MWMTVVGRMSESGLDWDAEMCVCVDEMCGCVDVCGGRMAGSGMD